MNERIREIREYYELSQRDFAKKIDVGASTLAMFETGNRIPKDIHIRRICDEFNVNETWLKSGEGAMLKDNDDIIKQATILLGKKDTDFEALIKTFSKLNSENRKLLVKLGQTLVENKEQKKE